jgi:hypothetical protein
MLLLCTVLLVVTIAAANAAPAPALILNRNTWGVA